ncbi:S41 family peptidase [Aquimarina sp. M1]
MTRIVIVILFSVFSYQIDTKTDPFSKRKNLISTIVKLTNEQICNPSFLETEQWSEFLTYIKSEDVLALDNNAFAKAFNKASKELTFSHFYLKTNRNSNTKTKVDLAFETEEIDNKTVVLRIRRFEPQASEMTKIVQRINEKQYKNLIIDLRDNAGGTLDAAIVLGRFLTNEMIDAGTYINRSWFIEENRYPTTEEIKTFPFIKSLNHKGFLEASGNPVFRMVLPPHQNTIYKGSVIVLTNSRTASTCEPFVHILKEKNIAKIIGEPTAGAMLSSQTFKLDNDFSLLLPVQDYVTAEGLRLDQHGVMPTIRTTSDKALEEALNQIE